MQEKMLLVIDRIIVCCKTKSQLVLNCIELCPFTILSYDRIKIVCQLFKKNKPPKIKENPYQSFDCDCKFEVIFAKGNLAFVMLQTQTTMI